MIMEIWRYHDKTSNIIKMEERLHLKIKIEMLFPLNINTIKVYWIEEKKNWEKYLFF
jgi:hypothetical protein